MTISARRVASVAIAFVLLFALHGALFHVILGLGWLTILLAVVSYLGAALVLGHALAWAGTVISEWRSAGSPPAWRTVFAPLVWLLMAAGAVVAWPAAVFPYVFPAQSLFAFAVVASFPAALAERTASGSTTERFALAWRRVLIALLLAFGVVAALRYLAAIRPFVEGVDYYLYVAFARDLLSGAADVSLARYHYFPGVYAFWKTALIVGRGASNALHWIYVAVIVVNAIAVAALAGRVCHNAAAGIVAALWYVIVASLFEGFIGATEPVATLPVLVGVVIWGGAPLSGARGMLRALALAAGIALGVYLKQPAGLLSLGWLAIVVTTMLQPAQDRSWRSLLGIPAVASLLLVGLIVLDGHGLEPLRLGFHFARGYEPTNSFVDNLRLTGLLDYPLLPGGVIAFALWLSIAAIPRFRDSLREPWAQVLGFTSVAGLAALAQFAKRGHFHYVVLLGPFLVSAAVIAGVITARWLVRTVPSKALAAFIVLAVTVIPLTRPAAFTVGLSVWPPRMAPELPFQMPWSANPAVASDLRSLRSVVHMGQDVLVLPPIRNDVHLMLGTRSVSLEQGYGWEGDPRMILDAVRSATLQAVIVIKARGGLWAANETVWRQCECDAVVTELPRAGFHPVSELPTMTLWAR